MYMKTKQCTKCKRWLPTTTEYFNKDKSKPCGLRPRCKECRIEDSKLYREKYPDKIKKNRQENYKEHRLEYRKRAHKHYCENKEKIKNKTKQYYQDNLEKIKPKQRKYYEANKGTIKKQAKKWKQNNPLKIKKSALKYRQGHKSLMKKLRQQWEQNNPQKVRMKLEKRRTLKQNLLATLSIEAWRETIKHFSSRCVYCGKELTDKEITQDHIIPITKSGHYISQNIVPCCLVCNSSKGNKDWEEWYKEQIFFSIKRYKKIYKWIGYNPETKILQLQMI